MNASEVRTLFANSLRRWRTHRRLTQEELAERSDLHRTYISDVERGARNLSLESIDKLARALDISIPSLFTPVTAPSLSPPSSPLARASATELLDILLIQASQKEVRASVESFHQVRFVNSVRAISSGAEALELFFGNDFVKQANYMRKLIVLLDLDLPDVSGLEVLRQLRSDERTRQIPVAILATPDRERDTLEARRLGAQAVLTKPLSFQALCQAASALDVTWAMLKPVPEMRD